MATLYKVGVSSASQKLTRGRFGDCQTANPEVDEFDSAIRCERKVTHMVASSGRVGWWKYALK